MLVINGLNQRYRTIKLNKIYTILVVDDAKDTLLLLDFDLSSQGYQVIKVESGELALTYLETHSVDLMLLDLYMPGLSGLETLKIIKETPELSHIPVIMLSASSEENEIVDALEYGADDYVTKPYIAKVLLARIRTSLRLMEKNQELEMLAKTDFLTGLNNRGNFYELSAKTINQCQRNAQSLVIAMLDIDKFKWVNDTYGHNIGDKVLVEFAHILLLSCRDYDIVGRIGGEEFAVCMPDISLENAMVVCERLRKKVENHRITLNQKTNEKLSITVSIGVTSKKCVNDDVSFDVDDLLRFADKGLYQAKDNGRNQVVNFDMLPQLSSDDNYLFPINNFDEENEPENFAIKTCFSGIDYSIGIANVLGDELLFKDILKMFYQEHEQYNEKLRTALLANDIKTAKYILHNLKGVSCSIGAMTLFEHAQTLENAIGNGELHRLMPLFDAGVDLELSTVLIGIKNQLLEI